MSLYAKYEAWIISRAQYDSDGVSFSTVAEDYPFELGPDQFYDTVSGLRRPWGRDPDGYPLLVTSVDRYTAQIIQHGVCGSSADVTPERDQIPAACIAVVKVSNAASLAAIDGDANHFVLGVRAIDSEVGLPPGLQPYDYDGEMPSNRWDTLRAGMINLGIPAAKLDQWRSNHPQASPHEVRNAFAAFIAQE